MSPSLKSGNRLALMTDASDLSWSIVLTQYPKSQHNLSIQERDHSPLVFMSGHFHNSELFWSVTEKEMFLIVVEMKNLRLMFCDHRNLIFVLDPGNEVSKNVGG